MKIPQALEHKGKHGILAGRVSGSAVEEHADAFYTALDFHKSETIRGVCAECDGADCACFPGGTGEFKPCKWYGIKASDATILCDEQSGDILIIESNTIVHTDGGDLSKPGRDPTYGFPERLCDGASDEWNATIVRS